MFLRAASPCSLVGHRGLALPLRADLCRLTINSRRIISPYHRASAIRTCLRTIVPARSAPASVPSCQRDPHLPSYHRASAIRTCHRTIVPARSAPASVPSCQRDPHLPPYHRANAIRTCRVPSCKRDTHLPPYHRANAIRTCRVPSCKRDTHLPRPIVFAFARVPPQGGEWIKGRRPCVGPGWVQLYCARRNCWWFGGKF